MSGRTCRCYSYHKLLRLPLQCFCCVSDVLSFPRVTRRTLVCTYGLVLGKTRNIPPSILCTLVFESLNTKIGRGGVHGMAHKRIIGDWWSFLSFYLFRSCRCLLTFSVDVKTILTNNKLILRKRDTIGD